VPEGEIFYTLQRRAEARRGTSGTPPCRERRSHEREVVTARHFPKAPRALELLASSHDGCTEAIMLAHGFSIDLMVNARLPTAQTERIVAGNYRGKRARLRIRKAGRLAVAGQNLRR
jgi:hypothetical protein